jgi:hypothetical protein
VGKPGRRLRYEDQEINKTTIFFFIYNLNQQSEFTFYFFSIKTTVLKLNLDFQDGGVQDRFKTGISGGLLLTK